MFVEEGVSACVGEGRVWVRAGVSLFVEEEVCVGEGRVCV